MFFEDYKSLIESISSLKKEKEGYGYKYLELTPLLDEVLPKIHEHNFIFVQTIRQTNGEIIRNTSEPAIFQKKDERRVEGELKKEIRTPAFILHSELIHKEGEKIECDMPLYVDDIDPQAIGSAETYMRRYSIYALLHIRTVDDDGLSGSAKGKENQKKVESKEPLPEDVNKIASFLSSQEDPKQYYWDIKNHEKLDDVTKRKIISTIIYPKG